MESWQDQLAVDWAAGPPGLPNCSSVADWLWVPFLPLPPGYCSYAPTKWALRGLADCLRNELLGTGVEVSVAYPPDTGGRAGSTKQ